jgi:hypothetical protein
LGQKRRTVVAGGEDYPVDVRAQLGERVCFAGEGQWLGRRQQRDFDAGDGQLIGAQRREARVAEGGVAGVFLNVGEQRTPGFEAADAAAQFTVLGQRDEGGTHFCQFRQVDRDRCLWQAETGGDGVAGQRQQGGAEVRHLAPP